MYYGQVVRWGDRDSDDEVRWSDVDADDDQARSESDDDRRDLSDDDEATGRRDDEPTAAQQTLTISGKRLRLTASQLRPQRQAESRWRRGADAQRQVLGRDLPACPPALGKFEIVNGKGCWTFEDCC